MTYNEFTQTELEYEFLYNLRDQTIFFSKLADGKHEKDLLDWLDGRILSLEKITLLGTISANYRTQFLYR